MRTAGHGAKAPWKPVLSYTLLPGILPRMRDLMSSGFGQLAYFMALVYRAVNILPPEHPYLRPAAVGTYGMRHVIAAAANNLTLSRSHIDQVIIFFAILVGLVIMAVQFALVLVMILINPAMAQGNMPEGYGDFLITRNPEEDLALRMLDRVFGVEGLFGSKDAGINSGFHEALHSLFQIYSIGLLVVAVLIVTYFIAAVIAETAQTGTPFGKRYDHVWAPIRLVVALGLLIPIGQGLNSAQWITLYAAKFGSGLATNGWLKFNETIRTTYLGDAEELIAEPNVPEMQHLGAFMTITQACRIATKNRHEQEIDAWLVLGSGTQESLSLTATSYEDALAFFENRDIYIRFGHHDPSTYTEQRGRVFPFCGDIIMQTTDLAEPGAKHMQEFYYNLIAELWSENKFDITTVATAFVACFDDDNSDGVLECDPSELPGPEFKKTIQEGLFQEAAEALQEAVEIQRAADLAPQEDLEKFGWGGAGIWYNNIARVNGALTAAAFNVPRPQRYPTTMEYTYSEKLQHDGSVPTPERFQPVLADGTSVKYANVGDEVIASILAKVDEYWLTGGYRGDVGSALTGNAFLDSINALLGTQGLFDMCKNTDIHPLAQLSTLGKGLIESAIRNLGFAVATGVGGGIGMILSPHIAGVGALGAAGMAASSFFVTIATIGITLGFILFYLVPFLPFLYFFFAVGGWVKGLFQAMVGVPLWALAHLRIDGQGLPGDAASGGYFLIFEIFIRPILIVFGLLAGISVFAAMIKVLNDIFFLVVSNLSGFNPERLNLCGQSEGVAPPVGSLEYFRGPVDEFFFTVVYTIIVYMIGMSCFKLIDMIPNHILRWMGAGVKGFNDSRESPADGLLMRMAVGSNMVGSQLQGAGKSLVDSGSNFGQGLYNIFRPRPETPPSEGG